MTGALSLIAVFKLQVYQKIIFLEYLDLAL